MGPKGIKPEDQIRKLSKIEANKVCIDCPEKVMILLLLLLFLMLMSFLFCRILP